MGSFRPIRQRVFVGRNGERPTYFYTPTDIITNQSELDTFLAQSAATLEGKVAGIQYNATPYTIARTQLRKNYGTGGLVLCRYGVTKPVFSAVAIENCTNLTAYELEVSNPSATSGNLISVYTQCDQIVIRSCVIHGQYYDPNGDYSAGYGGNAQGIGTLSNGSGSVGDLTIDGCALYDLDIGIVLNYASAASDWVIQGNEIYRTYEDNVKIAAATAFNTCGVNWNVLHDLIALGTDSGNPHADHIQFVGGSVDVPGITINGNVIFGGTARGAGQGIFLDDCSAGKYYTATIKGNVVACGLANGLKVNRAKNCTVIGNTVVARDVAQSAAVGIAIGQDEDGGGNALKNSVARTIATVGTNTNNHTISAQDTSAYAALFAGAAFDDSDLANRTLVLTALSMDAGGALDQAVNIGAVGSGYVDFDARTLNGAME